MTDVTPDFLNLKSGRFYSTAIERCDIDQIVCGKTEIGLNGNQAQLTFPYSGNFLYRLASPNTGFLIHLKFKTQTPAGTDAAAADITLASNWFAHLFQQATLKL